MSETNKLSDLKVVQAPYSGVTGDYFFPLSVTMPLALDDSGSPCNLEGEIRAFKFNLASPISVSKLALKCDNGAVEVGSVAFAVYDQAGQALMYQTGGLPMRASEAVNNVYTWTLPSVLALSPGEYFFAQTANGDMLNNLNGITCILLSSSLRVLVGVAGAVNPSIVKSPTLATVVDEDITFPVSMGALIESGYQPVACYFHN